MSELRPDAIVVSCSKGILNGTLETVEELLLRVLPPPARARLAFLSGPSFAKEARGGGGVRGAGRGARRMGCRRTGALLCARARSSGG